MVTEAYRNYIRSPKWKKKRQEVFAHYGKRCYACFKADKVLHVHHLTYARLGRESVRDLMPLCVPCHKEVTRLCRRNKGRGTFYVTMQYVKMKRASKSESRPVRPEQQDN